jgi:DeoR/GlpR family transcriptional regulator of sugar metabolism
MIKAASRVYLVADSSKINKSSFTRLGDLGLIHSFVTDDAVSDADVNAFEARGIEVLVAS